MSIAAIHHGILRMYGGFIFKQWKKRFLLLTADGSLLVCRDASSPPDQLVALHGGCEAIVEGSEILDLPKLPTGGQRDCCFALLLPEDKFLLLLADTPEDCSKWVNILKKAKESVSVPPRTCHRHRVSAPCIALNPGNEVSDMGPKQTSDKTQPVFDAEASSQSPTQSRVGSQRSRGRKSPRSRHNRVSSEGCLRHGTANNAESVRAVYLLMGGAAASSAMGYLGACSTANMEAAQAPDLPTDANFSGSEGLVHHSESHVVASTHFHNYEFQMGDMDYDVFDCGGGFSF